MAKITVKKAVENALAEARRGTLPATGANPRNGGDDRVFLHYDEEDALANKWNDKTFQVGAVTMYALDVLISSGQPKFDLRLARTAGGKSVFNYHVPFQRPAVDDAVKKQAAAAKKSAAVQREERETAEAAKKAAAKKAAPAQKAAARAAGQQDQKIRTDYNAYKAKAKGKKMTLEEYTVKWHEARS